MSILSPFKFLVLRAGNYYAQWLCAHEYKNQTVSLINERPIEFSFVFRQLTALWPNKILDVGTGMTALPHLMRNCGFYVTAADNIKDYWPKGMVNRHYHVINDDITHTTIDETYDVITCISVLEHIQNHREAIKSMYKLLVPGGHLILTCPYNERQYVRNVYDLPESSVTKKFPFITQAFSRSELNVWLEDVPFELVQQEYLQFFDGNYWTCGERIIPPRNVGVDEKHQHACILLKKPK